jgi:hypothetical protein
MTPRRALVAVCLVAVLACSCSNSPSSGGTSDGGGADDHAAPSDSASTCGADAGLCETGGVDGSVDSADGSDSGLTDVADAPPDRGMASTDGSDAGPTDIADATPDRGADGVGCDACVTQSCGSQLSTCLGAPACVEALQCVATTCQSGAALNLTCVQGCTEGGATVQQQLFALIDCIVSACSSVCFGSLGDLTDGG